MLRRTKSILFVICAVMAFSAQTNRPDDKGQHNNQSRPQAQHGPQIQNRPQVQNRPQHVQIKEAPRKAVHQAPPKVQTVQTHVFQASRQEKRTPRTYAVHPPVPVANNRLLHRQHHNHWRPRYNFYDHQYHFYPYIDIASTVELSANCVSVGFDGQTYFYDEGTFYQQDAQGQYVAVAPPVGIIVTNIPADARQVDIDGQTYYRYKGVFYLRVQQGYQVVGPIEALADDS